MEDKIEGCENDVGITDPVWTDKYRGQTIRIVARDLLDDESNDLATFYQNAIAKVEKMKDNPPKPEDLVGTEGAFMLHEDSVKMLIMRTCFHLGAKTKIADEGWYGIDKRFLMKKLPDMPGRKQDLPVTVEVLEALAPKIRDAIINNVWRHFRFSSEAESKNSTGR